MIGSKDINLWQGFGWLLPSARKNKQDAQTLRLPKYFFKTKRLIFRPYSPDDLHSVHQITRKPEVMAHVDDGQPMAEELVREWISFSRKNISKLGSGTGAVIERKSNRLIGWAGLSRPEGSPPEIVYGLDSSVWRQGYGEEITAGLVKWCQKDLKLDHIRATAYPENKGSIRILEKLGFEYIDDLYGDNGKVCRLYVMPHESS